MSYVLISFETPHHTIRAEKVLEERAITRAVYPIPREISRDCGLGLRVFQDDLNKALEIFQELGILYKHVFPVTDDDKISLMDKMQMKNQPS